MGIGKIMVKTKVLAAIPTTTQVTLPFDEAGDSNNDSKNNYFFDSFNPVKETEQIWLKVYVLMTISKMFVLQLHRNLHSLWNLPKLMSMI